MGDLAGELRLAGVRRREGVIPLHGWGVSWYKPRCDGSLAVRPLAKFHPVHTKDIPIPMARRLFCTACDDGFAEGLQVMLYSMRRHVPDFSDADLKVFYDPQISGLSPANQAAIARVAPWVQFEAVENAIYRNARVTIEHHRPALLTLEAFRQYDYDQVLFFDGDMLCVSDFGGALQLAEEYDFVACEAGKVCIQGRWAKQEGPRHGRWGRRRHWGMFGRRTTKVNTGFFVVGKQLRTPRLYNRLLRKVRFRMTRKAMLLDQWIINEVIGRVPASLFLLPNTYNLRAFARYEEAELAQQTKILHYSGYHQRPKPWAEDAPLDHPAYAIWRQYAADLVAELKSQSDDPATISLARYQQAA